MRIEGWAIIDQDPRSNQPFLDEKFGLALTYNGEIYNYRDLRRDLLRRGYRFRTESERKYFARHLLVGGLIASNVCWECLLSQSTIPLLHCVVIQLPCTTSGDVVARASS
ncbi:hypothetical protein IVB44_34865 [Bradyrhizobium sp. 49]|nr:hypothetical protein [Bradyrhizobium sp. 84]MCK1376055.1 hypothetical protein [Bradyrhizobium sp. 49]